MFFNGINSENYSPPFTYHVSFHYVMTPKLHLYIKISSSNVILTLRYYYIYFIMHIVEYSDLSADCLLH